MHAGRRFGLFSKHSLREPATSRTQYRAGADLDSATSDRLIHFYGGGRLSLLQYSRRKICGVELLVSLLYRMLKPGLPMPFCDWAPCSEFAACGSGSFAGGRIGSGSLKATAC